ncbi:NTP pyrophosphohydrolase [Streptomyces sp. DSM 44915]|uniref:NTP pyrophosphohydrolase n=1 Tax=Streptomyces chisholmiae TaxID=3075540 RepID=A0ABU2JP50_9ACTN|nr:NTP pyrophosphohydrolase [Streptomyces sp. DSM 44915]MDT0266284.1 NTP pyrophosphohydrolase [Streptomyces sp. DSM 44915]
MTDGQTEGAASGPVDPGRAPLLLVDGANVVGSVPDGWWRDRRGAAERLRDRLAGRAGPEELVLVVEGAARGVAPVPGVRVVSAPGSGDDQVVELVRAAGAGRRCLVVTADRGLRERVLALGAEVRGPRQLLAEIPPAER